MEHRLNKKVILFCFSLILVIISLIATPTIYSFLCYEKNQVGESYGKAAEMIDGSGFLKNPDLIEIIADNGKKGYVPTLGDQQPEGQKKSRSCLAV